MFFEFVNLSAGMLPFVIMAGAVVVLLVALMFSRLESNDIVEILVSVGTIWLIVMAVMLFVHMVCAGINVREGFADTDVKRSDIEELEQQVCTLMASSDTYITNDVGQPGQDNPSVLVSAKQTARGTAPIIECTMTDVQKAERLSRIENTLKNFTGPQLKNTYDKTVPCVEGFYAGGSLSDRFKAVKKMVEKQKTSYLKPIEQKEKDVKAGKLSDCEKKRASRAAVVGSGSVGL
jgi:hypothetical protein